MGGLCSRSCTVNNASCRSLAHGNGHVNHGTGLVYESQGLVPQKDLFQSSVSESIDKQLPESFLCPEINTVSYGMPPSDINDGIPRLSRALSHKSKATMSKQTAVAKVSEVSLLLGKASTAGLGKAVEVLDTLGSSMTNLNLGSGFGSGVAVKGNKITILAFEVANTIVKGANLMQSLSKENIRHLKEAVLPSEGVQQLISKDMDHLLRIAAADKRDELKIFSGEVVRFGNRCKDPQWHNLERYFEKLVSELTPQSHLKEEAEAMMQQLMALVQYTAELYHEWNALDRFEQDYQRKLQEEGNSNGDSLAILRAELKSQRKHVKSLKKNSFWCMILEEVMEKLVDIVHFLHLEIHDAFGCADLVDADSPVKYSLNPCQLGPAGLALHYANIVTQIDTLVSRSSSVPPSTRDALYQGLPPCIKSSLRAKILSFQAGELTLAQIIAEMEKTLRWLVPIATNTTKAHHGFGWVGEWANTGSEVNRKPTGQTELIRIETLHHADKDTTEAYILELVAWLHHLISQSRCNAKGGIKSPVKSPSQKTSQLSPHKSNSRCPALTVEDREMLQDVCKRRPTPGISKSQEFDSAKSNRLSKHHRLSKSSSHSPTSEIRKGLFAFRRPSSVPVIDFDIDRIKALDVIDRVDTIRSL